MNTKSLDFLKFPANEPINQIDDQVFKKMVKLSLLLHATLFLFLGLKAVLFPHETLNLDTAVRVDIVDLPDKVQTIPEKQIPQKLAMPAPAEPAKKIEAVKEKEPVAKPDVVKLTKKAEREKSLKKIEEFKEQERRKHALEEIENEVHKEDVQKVKAALLKGNRVAPGTALKGLTKNEFNEYIGEIRNHVQEHWNLPEWLQNDTLKVVIVVYIDFRGTVVKRVVEHSSGDSRFDGYALKAVDEADPFPKPPDKFTDLVKAEGIVLRFPQ